MILFISFSVKLWKDTWTIYTDFDIFCLNENYNGCDYMNIIYIVYDIMLADVAKLRMKRCYIN